ncbi:hypothetical protein ACQKCO_05215 [Shewanella baltica]|uniref:hypothetical protein n=1 Tax=Shewanella baltica TaxID=62322 RepID=UPI00217D25EA|nr:hypothetical protein [Shewanella baltica]MCS6162346.1 hypothetical protein [Shewanella baltica]
MQAIIQKHLQSTLFYLLVAVLIMMAGIIVGYLWSDDIGQWFYSENNSDGIGLSNLLALVGVVFTVLTYLLAYKAYRQWRHPFMLDKHQRLMALNGLMAKLATLNIKYQRALIELRKAGRDNFINLKEHAINTLLEHEELISSVSAYDDLLLGLNDNQKYGKTFAMQYSLSSQVTSLVSAGRSEDIDWELFDRQRSLTLRLACVVGQQVYKKLHKSSNELPT